jgi:hypothetical protein
VAKDRCGDEQKSSQIDGNPTHGLGNMGSDQFD